METFPTGHSKIGFIENNDGTEFLTNREAKMVMEQLKKFHNINIEDLPPTLKKTLKKYKDDYKSFEKEINTALNKRVVPLDAKNKKAEPTHFVLERRLGIEDLKEKVKKVFTSLKPIIDIKENRSTTLVHGDMAPNNLYVFDSGDVELLDLEWVGLCNNKAIAVIRDFGNLHARSWGNDHFRKSLETTLLKQYADIGKKELGKAILALSILRSHINIAGFFENYPWEKQKDPEQTIRRNSWSFGAFGLKYSSYGITRRNQGGTAGKIRTAQIKRDQPVPIARTARFSNQHTQRKL